MKRERLVILLMILAASILLTACPERTTIARLESDPGRYRDREILVVGTVTNSFGVLGQGAYELSDETGQVWVITQRGVPTKGARVGTVGRFVDGVRWGGRSFGSAIRETERKVR
ncbi:MAG: hypothetical protein ACK562_12410 [Acidobacteriota bacterium]|jgi:hypothetical protein